MIRKILFFSLILSYSFTLSAQDKTSMQQQRDKIKEEIEQTQKMLNDIQKTTKVNTGQLALINKKVNLQERVVDNIHKEIRNLTDEIYLSQLEINRMNRVLDTLKEEYAKSMVYAYKSRGNYSFLNFIFSAEGFNDAIKRIAYLKSYRNLREVQADNIIKTQSLLEEKINSLGESKERKNVVLKEEDSEKVKLEKQKNEKAAIVNQLKGKQKELNSIIATKRREDTKLKNAIAAMVKREIELAKAEAAKKEKERLEALRKEKERADALAKANARTNASANNAGTAESAAKPSTPAVAEVKKETEAPAKFTAPSNSVLVNTDAEVALNNNFESNKGKLPWPVNGYILYHYGNNTFPGNVVYQNFGVTIASKIGEPVKAVFEGEVTLVNFMEDNQAVFIKHGRYFTVYSNLTNVTVKRGDRVKTGQTIGRAGENDEGEGGRVEFLLLRETDYQNPQAWLK